MKRSRETWIISKVKYYWGFCSKTTRGLSTILKNLSLAHERQRFHDAFDVISLSQSAVFPHCPAGVFHRKSTAHEQTGIRQSGELFIVSYHGELITGELSNLEISIFGMQNTEH